MFRLIELCNSFHSASFTACNRQHVIRTADIYLAWLWPLTFSSCQWRPSSKMGHVGCQHPSLRWHSVRLYTGFTVFSIQRLCASTSSYCVTRQTGLTNCWLQPLGKDKNAPLGGDDSVACCPFILCICISLLLWTVGDLSLHVCLLGGSAEVAVCEARSFTKLPCLQCNQVTLIGEGSVEDDFRKEHRVVDRQQRGSDPVSALVPCSNPAWYVLRSEQVLFTTAIRWLRSETC